ncbi:MAG: electron transfer flavoprotein-ubiquinone oxidoreductase [Deltaproteobacteria bacterium]|nr:electron transfer flavoprotein-ubiquinone oxidoreductase [Deltaproteobacteria bacterium]MBW1977952.1 electron transfer flavoprotein-ubiquinone oxidoreductase [Deltaproteobacteria bacterium]MBW2044035.1 electron transfer flavoprotein-ubiquinone oxidoreductase [Deltaproteobacteria bacterium]MBW2301053.1 electron transfer flavoprotein-ubiquinone oxidoreductase [Deltaproteobacteria bacterium]
MEEREVMEVDVLFVGGGVASLSGALHLANLIKKHNEKVENTGEGTKLQEVMIAVLEKGAYVGAHGISGAVMDPVALRELVPDFIEKGAPLESEVKKEEVCLFTGKGRIKSPIVPPPLNNHGNYVVSLSRLTEWLGKMVEESGVDIFPGFAGTEVLYDGDRVIGVRTGDKGIDSDGTKKPNFEPGIDLHAKVTIFGEGSRGSLAKTLIKRFSLDQGKNPQSFVVGVKEVWEVPEGRIQPGHVVHSMGYPLKSDTYGGSFIYGMKENKVSIGLLTGLDYEDPFLDPHREFQKFKLHPYVASIIEGGKLIQYGAKTAPVGGYFSVPRVSFPGGLLIGDSASLFISQKIKGIHMGMKSGMLAAETVFEALVKNDFSDSQLDKYRTALSESYVGKELYRVRNFHQAFQKGLWWGLTKAGLQYVLGGRILKSRLEADPDFLHMKKVVDFYGKKTPSEQEKGDIKFDGERTFDKETDVYYSGTTHEEKQPPHLKIPDLNICYGKCSEEYQNPCVRFCPAGVYEIEVDEETGKRELKLNFSNCVHCKTCDVKDPYENITWVPPEGGGGPKYTLM